MSTKPGYTICYHRPDGWYVDVHHAIGPPVTKVGPYATRWGASRIGRRALREHAAFQTTPLGRLGIAIDACYEAKRQGQTERLPELAQAVEVAREAAGM